MKEQKTNSRYLPFDMARAICAIYIVGIWHLNSYLSSDYTFSNSSLRILHIITEVILGAFTFLSGYFLKRYQFSTISDIKGFYFKRFKRFYLLLFISAITFYILKWITPNQFFQVISGTNLFFGQSVSTLWYFSMIIMFYIITPIISFNYPKRYINFLSSFVCFCVFYLLCRFHSADYRLMLYFPCYVLGLNTNQGFFSIKKRVAYILIPVICLSFFINPNIIGIHITQVLCGVWLLLLLCVLIYSHKIDRIILFLSTGSMVAYLFHRQIFSCARFLFETFEHLHYIPIIIALLVLCVTFVVSYYIQVLYDQFLKLWKKKIKSA